MSPTAVCKMMELIEDEDFRPQEKEGIKHWPSLREKLSEGQRNRVEELLDRHRDLVKGNQVSQTEQKSDWRQVQ